MPNLVVIDGAGQVVYIKASGIGTDLDPFVLERFGVVDVATSALPDGASTEDKQDSQIAELINLVAAIDVDKMRTVLVEELPAGLQKIGSVDIDALIGELPAGTQKIGIVDVDVILTELPAGTQKIGSVDVETLPELPEGANKIGGVEITDPLPVGTNLIGGVELRDSIPAGANNIGLVEVNALNFNPTPGSHTADPVSTVTTLTPPNGETKLLLQAWDGNLLVTFEGTDPEVGSLGYEISPDQPMLIYVMPDMIVKVLADGGILQYEWGN